MSDKHSSIIGYFKMKNKVERTAGIIFTAFAFFAVLAVFSITLYMILSGTPAIFEVGLKEILFGTLWKPTAENPSLIGDPYRILKKIKCIPILCRYRIKYKNQVKSLKKDRSSHEK